MSLQKKKNFDDKVSKINDYQKKLLKYTWIIMGLQDKGQSFLIYTELNFLL